MLSSIAKRFLKRNDSLQTIVFFNKTRVHTHSHTFIHTHIHTQTHTHTHTHIHTHTHTHMYVHNNVHRFKHEGNGWGTKFEITKFETIGDKI